MQDFHAGRGPISLSLTFAMTIVAFGLPFSGRLIDRVGARKVILVSTFLAGLILLSAYFCSRTIWHLYLFYAALGVAACGLGPVPYCNVISHWFDRHRGLALGFMMSGLGMGVTVMPAAAQYLITKFGWRLTFGIFGSEILVISFPILAAILRDKPAVMGLWPDGKASAFNEFPEVDTEAGLSWSEACRTPTFWVLFCACILVSASVQACVTHFAAVLADRGISVRAAALATSVLGAGLLVGRTGLGYLLDRFFAPRVAAIIFGCSAAGIGLLRTPGAQAVGFVAAFAIGLGLGAEVDIMAYLTSRYFGLRSFATIYGVIFAGFGLAGGLGTYLMGVAFDATGSYVLTLALLCVATSVGAALMMTLRPYRYQVKASAETRTQIEMLPSES